MNKFALGVITTMFLTTREGNSALRTGAKLVNKVVKSKYNLDLKELLNDEIISNESEDKTDGDE